MAAGKGSASQKREALVRMYEESYVRVARYFYVRIGDQQEAEDLASETFVRALRSLDSYQERGLPMEAWVFRIARNLAVDHVRKAGKRQTVTLDEVPVRDTVDAEEQAEIDIESERVMAALDHLSESHREVISLRFFSGLSSKECARILGKKPGAVREMQSAAIKNLRKLLAGNGES